MVANLEKINIDKITSFKTILLELEKLDKVLSRRELYQFQLFNQAYTVVTKNIKKSAKNNYFKNPKFIEKFTVCFSHYYFRAVNETMQKNSNIPPAWKALNVTAKNKHTPQFIYLLMGANAHINNDLPLALNELMGKLKAEDLLKDVLKIDKLLMMSGREIISAFEESNKILDFLKRNSVFLYYRPVMYLVLFWRVKAWRNYRSIKRAGAISNHYQDASIRIAYRLQTMAKLLS